MVIEVPEKTVRFAVLLAGPIGASVVVTPEVEFGLTPALLLVTSKSTVQLPLGGTRPISPSSR